MSTEYTEIPNTGVAVRVSLDWDGLGAAFARAGADNQAQFLEAAADALRREGGNMQLAWIADWINNPENMFAPREIRWLLEGIAEGLETQ
jgi:hypothetical protein